MMETKIFHTSEAFSTSLCSRSLEQTGRIVQVSDRGFFFLTFSILPYGEAEVFKKELDAASGHTEFPQMTKQFRFIFKTLFLK